MRSSIFDDLDEIRRRQAEIAIKEHYGCERCGNTLGVTRDQRGTAYHYEGKIGDENDPNYANLCELCWPDEHAYWKEMWEEYYSGLL